MANQFFSYKNPNTTTTQTYTVEPTPQQQPLPSLSAAMYTTRATLADSYLPSDSSVYAAAAAAARYRLPSSKLTTHSSFPASSIYNYHENEIGADVPYSVGEYSRIGALTGRDVWSGVDGISYQSLTLKRSSEGWCYAFVCIFALMKIFDVIYTHI